MDKRFLSILAGLVVVFAGIFIISQHSSNSSGSGGNASQATNHVTGKGQKGVTLVEYGDYQCPVCGVYYQPLKQAVSQLNNDIYFQFRNLPLVQIHQNAFSAARAAEAAGKQNKYWEMHDILYDENLKYNGAQAQGSNYSTWISSSNPLSYFTTYAQQLKLDVTKFKADYASGQVNDAINADLAAFKKTGQDQATPTFYLNGKYLPNSELTDPSTNQPSAAKITAVINAEIVKQNKQ